MVISTSMTYRSATGIPGKIKVLIIDDEEDARDNIRSIIDELPEAPVAVVGMAHNTAAGEELIRRHSPDAVFIDINMPGENAFQFLERIRPFPFQVVFVTAYHEYALHAFRINAVDYVLKPVSSTEIAEAVKKLSQRLAGSRMLEELGFYTSLYNGLSKGSEFKQVRFRTNNSLEIVAIPDLYYIEALRAYSRVSFAANGINREIIISQPLAEYEEILPAQLFYRIHKSYLVNCMHVQKVVSSPVPAAVMKNGATLPISRRKFASFTSFLSGNTHLRKP